MVEDGSDVHAVETDGSFDGSIFLANIRCNPTPTRIDSADYDRRAKNRSIRVSRHSLATWHTHMQVTQSVVQWFSVSKLEVPQGVAGFLDVARSPNFGALSPVQYSGSYPGL
eukprot:7570201-Pyramimonas_sp.AAC.1